MGVEGKPHVIVSDVLGATVPLSFFVTGVEGKSSVGVGSAKQEFVPSLLEEVELSLGSTLPFTAVSRDGSVAGERGGIV